MEITATWQYYIDIDILSSPRPADKTGRKIELAPIKNGAMSYLIEAG